MIRLYEQFMKVLLEAFQVERHRQFPVGKISKIGPFLFQFSFHGSPQKSATSAEMKGFSLVRLYEQLIKALLKVFQAGRHSQNLTNKRFLIGMNAAFLRPRFGAEDNFSANCKQNIFL